MNDKWKEPKWLQSLVVSNQPHAILAKWITPTCCVMYDEEGNADPMNWNMPDAYFVAHKSRMWTTITEQQALKILEKLKK